MFVMCYMKDMLQVSLPS